MRRTRWIGAFVVLALAVGGCFDAIATPPPATPQPTPATGPPADLVELTTRIRAADATTGRFVRDLGAALTTGPVAVAGVGDQISRWATAEIAWFDAHEPGPCWMAAADAYRSAVALIGRAGEAFLEPDRSDADGQAAATSLAAGREGLASADAQATAAIRTCAT